MFKPFAVQGQVLPSHPLVIWAVVLLTGLCKKFFPVRLRGCLAHARVNLMHQATCAALPCACVDTVQYHIKIIVMYDLSASLFQTILCRLGVNTSMNILPYIYFLIDNVYILYTSCIIIMSGVSARQSTRSVPYL